ncbi:MAG: IS21 family transposase [Polyangiales bacterium]
MDEMNQHGAIGRAAMKAGMDRKTARKYIAAATMPSTMETPRTWRTRRDPFEEHNERIEQLLIEHPDIDATTVFAFLVREFPGRFHDGQLRTLQRKIAHWRASKDDASALAMLTQRHRPGEAAQTDFTHADELGIVIAGVALEHLLGVFVLPFSNWRWITVCFSESLLAIRSTVQRALFQLGRAPAWHQTDNSTAATHHVRTAGQLHGKSRDFNNDYLALMRHFSMQPRTIEVGESQQNGDVEAINGAAKRGIEQALILRGSREFESIESYQRWLDDFCRAGNKSRAARLASELEAMHPLPKEALIEYVEERAKVASTSTILVRRNRYSVPPRLIGTELRVRVFESRIEAYFGERCELRCDRIIGDGKHRIDYRHMVWSLLRKPGAFERFVYREEMFPTLTFRRAFEALGEQRQGVARDREYLRILHLAASTMESDVDVALALLLEQREAVTFERVKELSDTRRRPQPPALRPMKPDLAEYDALLSKAVNQ